jgi:hypothetical protein
MRGTTKLGLALRSLALIVGVSLLAFAKAPDRDKDGVPDKKDACPDDAAPRKAAAKNKGCPEQHGPEATFIGFNVGASGASMVFVQLTDEVPVEVSQSQGAMSFLLKGARVVKKNNFNPLPAAAFGSALARAQLLPDKAGVRLVLSLRTRVKLSHRLVRQGRGAVLEVNIPAPGTNQ